MHEGVADAQQRERDDHEYQSRRAGGARVGDNRQQHGHGGDDQRNKDRSAAPDFVHQHAGGYGENQEPEKHHGGEQVCLGVGQVEFRLDIIRGGADKVDKAHDEERGHDGGKRPDCGVLRRRGGVAHDFPF